MLTAGAGAEYRRLPPPRLPQEWEGVVGFQEAAVAVGSPGAVAGAADFPGVVAAAEDYRQAMAAAAAPLPRLARGSVARCLIWGQSEWRFGEQRSALQALPGEPRPRWRYFRPTSPSSRPPCVFCERSTPPAAASPHPGSDWTRSDHNLNRN